MEVEKNRRRSARVHSLGAGTAAGDPDARGQYHDGKSNCCGTARHAARRRTDHPEPSRWSRCSVSRHLDRYNRARKAVMSMSQIGFGYLRAGSLRLCLPYRTISCS